MYNLIGVIGGLAVIFISILPILVAIYIFKHW